MKKKKIYSLRVLGETVSKNIRDDDFYTTDTDTWLEFSLVDKTLTPETMSISLVNSNDGSAVNEVVALTETETILFRLDPEIIVHAGTWHGQVVFESNGEMYTSKSFAFGVLSNVMDNNVPQLIKIANFKHFKQMLEELTRQGEVFEENELARESAESGRVNAEKSRVTAEGARVSAEQARVSAETIRKGFYEGFDGRLVGLESERMVLKNELINGEFSNGTTNWAAGGSVFTVFNGVAEIKSTSDWNGRISQRLYGGGVGKYYIFADIKAESVSVGLSFINFAALSVGHRGDNTYQRLSAIVSSEQDDPLFTIVDKSSAALAKPFYADNVGAINLTKTFGAGNEPTKSEMDELIKITGYFDEITLTQKQLLNWQLKLMRQNRNALIALGGTII